MFSPTFPFLTVFVIYFFVFCLAFFLVASRLSCCSCIKKLPILYFLNLPSLQFNFKFLYFLNLQLNGFFSFWNLQDFLEMVCAAIKDLVI